MNKSFSKIRHIQEANALLEKRTLNEQDNTVAVGQADTWKMWKHGEFQLDDNWDEDHTK